MLNRTVIRYFSTRVKMLPKYKKIDTKSYLEEFIYIPKSIEKLKRKGDAGRVCVIGMLFSRTLVYLWLEMSFVS